MVFIRCYSARRTREGIRVRVYGADEIDAVAAYCAELDTCYLLPISKVAGRRQVQLRLAPARNNQRFGVNWAGRFEFSTVDWSVPGAIAQLGERSAGSRKVAGSSPASSTRNPLAS